MNMTGTSRKLMRITLLALLFQFIAPAFLSLATCAQAAGDGNMYSVCIHTHYRSIAIPQLLKEKNETEREADAFDADLVPLMDLTVHSFALILLHANKLIPFAYKDRIDHRPPLFTLHHAFII